MIEAIPHESVQRNGKAPRARVRGTAKSRFGRQTRKMTGDLRTLRDIAEDVVHEKLSELRDSAADYYDRQRDKTQLVQRSLERHIQERPLKSVLIGVGIGVLLGRFWRHR